MFLFHDIDDNDDDDNNDDDDDNDDNNNDDDDDDDDYLRVNNDINDVAVVTTFSLGNINSPE